VQQQALNGAQMSSLQQITQAVADGALPYESAIQLVMIGIPSISKETAQALINPAKDFTPKPQGDSAAKV
jgi:hypothetical protein